MSTENVTRDLVIVGAGGLAPEAVWAAEDANTADAAAGRSPRWNILGFVIYDPSVAPAELYDYPVLGTPEDLAAKMPGRRIHYVCAIGDNRIREQEVRRVEPLGWTAATLIHPSAIIARGAGIGPGSYIAAGAIVAPFARVGAHVVVNLHASVGHDSTIGDFSNVCPGARLSGRCALGRSAFIGTNAVVLPRVEVREGAVVGAGSLAAQNVDAFTSVIGVPARVVRSSAPQSVAPPA